MASKTCVKCKKTFEPFQTYFSHCNRCFREVSNSCEVCEGPCIKKRCYRCIDRVMENCKICKKLSYHTGCCRGCSRVYYELPWQKWSGVEEKGKVEVVYSVTKNTHDGYCSDADELISEESEQTVIYPLCSDGVKNEFYERNPDYTCFCPVECGLTYKIKSIKRID